MVFDAIGLDEISKRSGLERGKVIQWPLCILTYRMRKLSMIDQQRRIRHWGGMEEKEARDSTVSDDVPS